MAAYAVAAVLLVAAAIRYLDRRDQHQVAGGGAPVALDGAGARKEARGSEGTRRRIYVHVAGAVDRPGLYRVPAGSRTAAVIARAGGLGPRADLELINLAAPLQDGQQVSVPREGEAPAGAPATASTGSSVGPAGGAVAGTPISLASATPAQLEELDGIGPTLAARIIEYRDENGGFESVDELREVDGIGDKRLESLSEAVRP